MVCDADTSTARARVASVTGLRVGSAFSGIGGFDLAAEQAGAHVAWQIEIDKHASAVLAHHWPEVTRYGDITSLDPSTLAPVDLICGGFPCQDLSVAGRRQGLGGARSGLFWELLRIVAVLRPRWILLENVPGLLSSNRGRDLGTVLTAVGDLGYGWAYRVLDAQWFGVGQRRRRWFLVGCLGHRTSAAAILLEPDGVPGDPPPRRTPGPVAPTIPSSGAGVGRTGNQRTEADFLVTAATLTGGSAATPGVNAPGRHQEDDVNLVTQALTGTFANGGADDNKAQAGFLVPTVGYALRSDPGGTGPGHNVTYIPIQDVRGGTRDKTDAGQGIGIAAEGAPMYTLNATEQHAVAVALTGHAGHHYDGESETFVPLGVGLGSYPVVGAGLAPTMTGRNGDPGCVTHALTAEGADASEDGTGRGTPLVGGTLKQTAQAFSTNQRGEARVRDVHGSLTASHSGTQGDGVAQRMAVRRLMPLECERLQGFPDDWTRWGVRDGAVVDLDAERTAYPKRTDPPQEIADSPRYRMIGNAVAVPVVRWIFERIAAVERSVIP